jgi:hypothetical protein
MTRAKTTWLASAALAFTFTDTAAADTPDQPQNPDEDVTTPTTTPPPVTTTTTVVVPEPQPAPASSTTVITTTPTRTYERDRYEFGISAGGGAGGFTSARMRSGTDVGGEWGVRLTFGTRSPFAIEASYIGSAQRIKALGLDDNAYLIGNGVQGAARLNLTLDLPVQPFLFAGGAWRRYDLANTATNLSDVNEVDNVFELPLGVGIAGHASGLMLDVRGEFRPAFDEDLLPEVADNGLTSSGAVPMHRWGVNANVGYEF